MSSLTLEPGTIDQARAEGFDDLLALYWEDVELNQDKNPLAINWHAYYGLERLGVLKLFLLRRDGRLIGFTGWFVNTLLRYSKTLWAVSDLLWVEPEERKGSTGIFLITKSEQMLRASGVKAIRYEVKTGDFGSDHGHGSVGYLLRRLGYTPYEEALTRYL